MKKISKGKDHWGEIVIYVQKCDKYEYEEQNLHNTENNRVYDIMYLVENYYNDNSGDRYN